MQPSVVRRSSAMKYVPDLRVRRENFRSFPERGGVDHVEAAAEADCRDEDQQGRPQG